MLRWPGRQFDVIQIGVIELYETWLVTLTILRFVVISIPDSTYSKVRIFYKHMTWHLHTRRWSQLRGHSRPVE